MIFTDFNLFVFNYVKAANLFGLRQILVGGGAVNFHGYKRHSADVDFWIDPTEENFTNLISVVNSLGYALETFPQKVLDAKQNISIKATPEFDLELITRFNPNKPFQEAFEQAEIAMYSWEGEEETYRVLSFDDLVVSKLKANRPKDLLDITQLKQIRKK